MTAIVSVKNLSKTYAGGFQALKNVSLDIEQGEIIALLGPNGAGKTTLISTICGITTPSEGTVTVGGYDIDKDYRKTRQLIGLVPQELTVETFETVTNTTRMSRGLFGCKPDDAYIEKVLKSLSLWDKKDTQIRALSGGMKRRVLIAKALSHQPRILFLDEPTAGVDVELRKDMWNVIRELRDDGVTIILTTHYIEEAEEIADRVGVIAHGEILLVEDKDKLMAKLGQKSLEIELHEPASAIPDSLSKYALDLSKSGEKLTYTYDTNAERTGITALLTDLGKAGLVMKDLQTSQSTLEEIFVNLLKEDA